MTTLKPTSIPAKRLAETINGSASSFKLNNIEGWDGNNLTSSDFGSVAYVTFRNSSGAVFEIMEIDPSTIASASITISRRGLQFDGDLTTEVSANKLTWIKGDTIVELGSNPPQQFQWLKEYADGLSYAGAPDSSDTVKGIVEQATQAEVFSKASSGGTTAPLFVPANRMPSVLMNDYVADSGAADAYVITPSPAVTAYTAGQIFSFKAGNTNTGASTVNVNGLGTKTIKKNVSDDLAAGDILADQIVVIEYDGTNFQIVTNTPEERAFGDGSDGDVTISGATSLSRDMYYNNLTVNDTLTTNGYRIFVKGTLSGTGTIKYPNANNGSNASGQTGGTGGAAYTAGGFLRNTAGKNGGTGAASGGSIGGNGIAGADGHFGGTPVVGVSGGDGEDDDGSYGPGTPGAVGSDISKSKLGIIKWETLGILEMGTDQSLVVRSIIGNGSSSGGGGGNWDGGGGYGGGAGGNGATGGIVFIAARVWAGTFTIQALGGNGGNGAAGGNSDAGGGGGGIGGNGGVSIVVYQTKTWTGSYDLSPGTGGTGGPGTGERAGEDGTDGNDGESFEFELKDLI